MPFPAEKNVMRCKAAHVASTCTWQEVRTHDSLFSLKAIGRRINEHNKSAAKPVVSGVSEGSMAMDATHCVGTWHQCMGTLRLKRM